MTTASTKPLNFWDNKAWHYRVHQRLGETLYYFLVRNRPVDIEEAVADLKKMFKRNLLGSVRVFPLFGTYDFMIRAWLHPSIHTQFQTWVDEALSALGTHSMYPFEVQFIDVRAHNVPDVDRDLLDSLDENAIREVQKGKDLDFYHKLQEGNLIIERRRPPNIIFFTSIYLDDENLSINEGVVAAIKEYWKDNPGIFEASVYRGFGFGSILIKGSVQSFFNIAPLTNHIGKLYKSFGAHTETYLCHGHQHVAGDESIGDATFFALQGRDLFVQGIIPDLYDTLSPHRQIVADFLSSEGRKLSWTQRDKKLIRDFMFGFLANDATQMVTPLFALFHKLEAYLKSNYKEFIGRKGRKVSDIFAQAHLRSEDQDRPTLKNLFNVYAVTIKATVSQPDKSLTASWDPLAELRNDLIHANVDLLQDWQNVLKRLFPFLPRIRSLISVIEEETNHKYEGIY
jgi:hypothetical protein